MQTHEHEFPGEDPNDCQRNIKRDQLVFQQFLLLFQIKSFAYDFNCLFVSLRAILQQCNNAYYPDSYGHYREAKFVQTKHHWWWKANRVFDQLEVTRHHTG